MPAKLVTKITWVQGIQDRLIGGPCLFPVGDNCEITKYIHNIKKSSPELRENTNFSLKRQKASFGEGDLGW